MELLLDKETVINVVFFISNKTYMYYLRNNLTQKSMARAEQAQ